MVKDKQKVIRDLFYKRKLGHVQTNVIPVNSVVTLHYSCTLQYINIINELLL